MLDARAARPHRGRAAGPAGAGAVRAAGLALQPADAAADRRCRLGMGAPEPEQHGRRRWPWALALALACAAALGAGWSLRPPAAGLVAGGGGVGGRRRAGAAQRPVAVAAAAAAGASGPGPGGAVGRLAGDEPCAQHRHQLHPVGVLPGVGGRHRRLLRRAPLRQAQAGAQHQPRQELGGRVQRHGRRVCADAWPGARWSRISAPTA